MNEGVDSAAAVRAGESLDTDRLTQWLAGRLPGAASGITVAQFPRGHSNLTYLISVGGAEYVLRRPPFGNLVRTAHDMGREFRVLGALAPVFPEAPASLLFCEDDQVLGAPFYLMERRHGVILRRTLPVGMALSAPLARRLSRAVVEVLVRLHGLDYRAIGLADFGKPAGYVERQVTGWTERWVAAATGPLPAMDTVAAWLAAHIPLDAGAAVIHNDLKFDNLLLHVGDPGVIVAVLDWEMATIGDPLMDLGSALAYWIQADDPDELRAAAMGPTHLPGMWTRQELAREYTRLTGRPLGDLAFYYAFGLFKVAVIVQQIFARYVRGATTDSRFAGMDRLVAVLARQSERVAQRGTL